MNFTREPIIETVITPREGMKLLIRNSKANCQEDYFVDAVEVVSFGQALFFRSLERPKSFLVPMSDYEVIEMKEMKVPLKATSPEKSIKIGGGKEQRATPPREIAVEEKESLPLEPHAPTEARAPHHHEVRQQERKRDGKRRRGRRGPRHDSSSETNHGMAPSGSEEEKPLSLESVEEQKTPSFISKLFPPPPTLIKETLSRYKPVEPPVVKEEDLIVEERLEEELFELPESIDSSDEEN